MKPITIFLIISVLISHTFANSKTLYFYTCNEPPLNYSKTKKGINVKGEDVSGFSTDLIREILKRTTYMAEIQLLPWSRAYYYALNKKNCFVYSMARTFKREHLFKWIGPIAIKKQGLYELRGAGIKIKVLNDAKKIKRIGILRNDAKEEYLRTHNFKNIKLVNQWAHGLKMLITGKINLLASTDLDYPIIALEAGVDPNKIKLVYELSRSILYIGASKLTSDKIIRQLKKILSEIKDDGTFEKLIKKWAKYYNNSNWTFKNGVLQVRHLGN